VRRLARERSGFACRASDRPVYLDYFGLSLVHPDEERMPASKQDIGRKQPAVNIVPDWSATLTPDRAEQELPGFTWFGCGWYRRGDTEDTILVVPHDDCGRVFRFHVYNGRNPAADFNYITNMPTRHWDD
jgi:hypothetical protein